MQSLISPADLSPVRCVELLRNVRLSPLPTDTKLSSALALVRHRNAEPFCEKAIQADPVSVIAFCDSYTHTLVKVSQFEDALAVGKMTIELLELSWNCEPANFRVIQTLAAHQISVSCALSQAALELTAAHANLQPDRGLTELSFTIVREALALAPVIVDSHPAIFAQLHLQHAATFFAGDDLTDAVALFQSSGLALEFFSRDPNLFAKQLARSASYFAVAATLMDAELPSTKMIQRGAHALFGLPQKGFLECKREALPLTARAMELAIEQGAFYDAARFAKEVCTILGTDPLRAQIEVLARLRASLICAVDHVACSSLTESPDPVVLAWLATAIVHERALVRLDVGLKETSSVERVLNWLGQVANRFSLPKYAEAASAMRYLYREFAAE